MAIFIIINPCAAGLFVTIFQSCKAGIALTQSPKSNDKKCLWEIDISNVELLD